MCILKLFYEYLRVRQREQFSTERLYAYIGLKFEKVKKRELKTSLKCISGPVKSTCLP